jgi:hypothetical protein
MHNDKGRKFKKQKQEGTIEIDMEYCPFAYLHKK